MSRITATQLLDILRDGLPSGLAMNPEIVELGPGRATIQIETGAPDLRPGGTVAGPVLFGLADLAVFAAVLTSVGPQALAVTTDATVHFLRKPRPGTLIARARLLKEGGRLLVGEVAIAHASAPDDPVAHAVMTYSIPPTRPSQPAPTTH